MCVADKKGARVGGAYCSQPASTVKVTWNTNALVKRVIPTALDQD